MMGDYYESKVSAAAEVFDEMLESEIGDNSPSKEGKGSRLWKKVKYQLVEYHALPAYMRDNEYIHRYYRSEWPLKQVLLSVFTIHNETLNVWTHLIGFFLFLFLTIYTATKIPQVDLNSLQQWLGRPHFHKLPSELVKCLPDMAALRKMQEGFSFRTSLPSLDSLSGWHVMEYLTNCLPEQITQSNLSWDTLRQWGNDGTISLLIPRPITRWPFFVFLGGAMFCLLASSACHLLCCHSKRLSYIMLRLDYAGIAALISTSFYPPVYYSFMCTPFFCNLYLSAITLLGIATIIFSLLPVFDQPKFRTMRTSLFFGMGVSGVAPILHKLTLYRHQQEAVQTTGYEILMGLLYGAGALIYATRIPERWKPGRFDIAGHSHQLFHVLVVAAAYTHYQAGLIYLGWRDSKGCWSA
uniref:Uncharacterized protein n=1 Tax=Kalanchoe fedtschenkoi TaxID=63787 RepID=A0A7N0TR56_KALFE